MNGTGSRYTVWHYVGCGCAVLFVLAVLGIGGCFWMVTNWGRQMEAEIKDPAAREAKAKSILGYDELPAGYLPGISFSVPMVLDVVILGDRALPAGDDMEGMHDEGDLFDERGFLYFKMRAFGQGRDDVREDLDIEFEAERTVAEGELEAGGATVRYTARIGTAELGGRDVRSVASDLEIDCGDSFLREAVWFEPLPAAENEVETAAEPDADAESELEAAAEPELTGTPADEVALAAFLDHFRFCG